MFQGGRRSTVKKSQDTQSSVTKLFKMFKDRCSDNSSETVNLMKSKRKKSNTNSEKCCDCTDAQQQTNCENGCPQNRDDTFSFTSCYLKKLLSTESPRIMMALIVVVGALTVLLVLRCICCPAITDFALERRDRRSDDDRKPWEVSKSRLMNEFSELTGKESKDTNLHSGQDLEYPEYMLPELSSILDPIKVNEGYGSNNLREFYRKLLKTDIQIKNLKKVITNMKHGNSLDFTDPNSPRLKRSLKIFTNSARLHDRPASLNKRSIENNKYYLSAAWKVDDGKVLHDDSGVDQPDLSSLVEKAAETQKLVMKQQKNPEYTATDKGSILNTRQPEAATEKNPLEHLQSNRYEWFKSLFGSRERPSTQHRRLLQHEDDEDKDEGASEDYEDLTKEPWDREKRMVKPAELNNDKQTEAVNVEKLPKTADYERKEPKPVYSDEINYMIDAAIRMATGKLDAKENDKRFPRAVIKTNKEYIDDIGNYEDLVEMAQAYSDYGVLDSKKEISEKNKAIDTNHLLPTEKPRDILEQTYKIDNSLRGQRVKLKSNSETNSDKVNFLKKFKLKLFSKAANPKIKDNVVDTTAINDSGSKTSIFSRFAVTCTPWSIFTPKKAAKHKERNLMYSGHRRSLKSIEIKEVNDDAAAIDTDVEPNFNNTVKMEHNEDNATIHVKGYTNNVNVGSINEHNKFDVINETSINNASVNYVDIASKLSEGTLKRNDTSWGLGELFGMFADFCMFMSGFDENQEESGYRFLYDFVTKLNPNYLQTKNKTSAENFNDTRAPIKAPIEIPIDTEMVDNIGHRSRVLMSFEEKAENSTPASLDKEDSSESYVITTNKETANATREIKITNSSNIESKDAVVAGNRTVVKRSANGNAIFWNDLYDDEYGVKDPMEDDMKDKSSFKFNDLMEKDNWISNKFKILAKNLKERRNRKMEAKNNKKLKSSRNNTKNHVKRAVPVSDVSGKQMFEGLTANLKRVCHEAAQAIHETTNREVRADSNQASTLMQQLVSLMSELVDLQVRAKTCVQLPEDLRSFLAWLTSPSTEARDDIGFSVNSYDPGPNNMYTPDTYDLMSTTNARSDCLGTIHDVEDLILQYDEMSEEDKSKMSGVREYLEHQLHFLHKQLSSYNEYGSPGIYRDQPIRRRRQPNSIKKLRKRKAYKFLNYGRKHTRSTDIYDFGTDDYKALNFGGHKDINEYYKQEKIKEREENFENNDVDAIAKGNRKNENGLKRNLKDDYYSDLVKNNDTIFKRKT